MQLSFQGLQQTTIKLNRELQSLTACDAAPLAAPPAGPLEEPLSPCAQDSQAASPAPAVAALEAALPATVTAAASSMAFGSLQGSVETHTESDKSHRASPQAAAAAQDTLQSAVVSGVYYCITANFAMPVSSESSAVWTATHSDDCVSCGCTTIAALVHYYRFEYKHARQCCAQISK